MSTATLSVGQQLVDFINQGDIDSAFTLYSDAIVSVEPMSMPEMPARLEGIEAVRGKNQWWQNNNEIHNWETLGPFPHGDRFACLFKLDVTFKPTGQRMQMEEVALYTVQDGKIVHEEFFHHSPDCDA